MPPPLKPGSALLLTSLHHQAERGQVLTRSTAQYLTYFLQKLGGPYGRGVRFHTSRRGPASGAVDRVLELFDGTYLRLQPVGVEPRQSLSLSSGHYPLVQAYVGRELGGDQRLLPGRLMEITEGHETDFQLETLATVHFIRQLYARHSVPQIVEVVRAWSGRDAGELGPGGVIRALDRLERFAGALAF